MVIKVFTLLCIGLFISLSSQAGILAAKTRLIIKEGEREQSLMLANTNEYPIILQTWIDQGESNPDALDIPFLVLPPIVKIKPQGIQGIRIVYNGKPLPVDRESVFWLNLYEIPMTKRNKTQAAYMSLAMNTQLKLFYRPKQIVEMSSDSLAKRLKFKIVQEHNQTYLECNNPTAFHASLINLRLTLPEQSIAVQSEMDMMCYPFAKKRYSLGDSVSAGILYSLHFDLLDDQGNAQSVQMNLMPF